MALPKGPPMTNLLAPASKSLVEDLARQLSGPSRLAPLNSRRLSLLIELMDETGYIGYAAAYAQLFPENGRSPAEKTQLELQLDAKRNADPEQCCL